MLKRILTTLALPVLLASCGGFTAPERDNAQWTTELHGVSITWRWVNPGGLGPGRAGRAMVLPGGQSCVIDLDPTTIRNYLTEVAAHEAGHCLAARYLQVGADVNSENPHLHELMEQWPQAYAERYMADCGLSLAPLGWRDTREATCAAAPDIDDIK